MKAGYIIKHVTGTLVFFLFLFVSAGRINYWQGLIYAGIGLFMVALHYTILQPDAAVFRHADSARKRLLLFRGRPERRR